MDPRSVFGPFESAASAEGVTGPERAAISAIAISRSAITRERCPLRRGGHGSGGGPRDERLFADHHREARGDERQHRGREEGARGGAGQLEHPAGERGAEGGTDLMRAEDPAGAPDDRVAPGTVGGT